MESSGVNTSLREAEEHVGSAETAYEKQDYYMATEKASEAVYVMRESVERPEILKIFRKSLDIMNEALALSWSMEPNAVPDRTYISKLLSPAIYTLDTLDAMPAGGLKMHLLAEKEQLQSIIGNLDPTWAEERQLATELKEKCDRNGVEINPDETAKTMHKMALVHMKRAPDKINFLHASALFAAALARNSSNRQAILDDVQSLDQALLQAAGAQSLDSSLFQISQKIYTGPVKAMRAEARQALRDVTNIDGEKISADELKTKSAEFISKMEKIMAAIAEDYRSVMRVVAEQCISVLGEAPCKYSHVAMGSLARKEITTHSELESIILLENDAKKSPAYDDMLEYFRWYFVIFQTIVIYFGESPLRLLGIPSLNDFSFHCGVKDWFCDAITPCGIRFDHMMYFGDKFPLGRTTKNEKTGLELIMTVKDMMKLVSGKNASKSGHKYPDLLTRTCCIGGSGSLNRKFEKRVQKAISSEKDETRSLTDRNLRQMKENLYSFSYKKVISSEETEVNVKKAYSSVTVLINAIGHLLRIEDNPCFDIVRTLQSTNAVTEEGSQNLMLAVAIAHNIRLKVDMESSSQPGMVVSSNHIKRHEDETTVAGLFNFVGKWSILNFFIVVFELQNVVKMMVDGRGKSGALKNNSFKTEDTNTTAEICLHFGLNQEALHYMRNHDADACSVSYNVLYYLMKGLAYMKLAHYDDASENLNVCLAMVLSLPEVDRPELPHCIQYCLGMNMLSAQRFSEANGYLLQAREALESSVDNDSTTLQGKRLYIDVLKATAELQYSTGDYEAAYVTCQTLEARLMSGVSKNFKAKLLLLSGNCLKQIGHFKESVIQFEKALKGCQDNHGYGASRKSLPLTALLPILLNLGECYYKLNKLEASERYCNEAINVIRRLRQGERYDLAHVKLVLSQCYLKQNKYGNAAVEACEAFSIAFDLKHPRVDRTTITREAVKVIFRSLLPVRNKDWSHEHVYTQEDIEITLDCATKVFEMINEGSPLATKELERDKSILIRVIQKGIFETGGYNRISENCKLAFLHGDAPEQPTVLHHLILPFMGSPELQDDCKRNSERLIGIAKVCNIRDSISHSGAIIVIVGWIFQHHKGGDYSKDLLDEVETNFLRESDERKIVILHCAVKLAIHTIDYYVNRIEDYSILDEINDRITLLLNLATRIYSLVQSQRGACRNLTFESADLINSIATCWMRLKEYDQALEMFNEALSLQENLGGDSVVTFKGVTTILENIGICLARLHRLDEAGEYLHRGLSMKQSRRKSRVEEDNSILEVKVKSAKCSFGLGNFIEAASLACEAFHDGLGMDSGRKRNESMLSAAQLVLQSTLEASVHTKLEDKTNKYPPEVVQGILDSAITLRTTLKDRSEQLGRKFSELSDSLQYAAGNCHFVLQQYKLASKCFKKTLRKLKRSGQCTRTEKALILSIAKCQVGLGSYKKAQKNLKKFLAMGEGGTTLIGNLHPSHAHNLLAVCLIRQHNYKDACLQSFRALAEAQKTSSSALIKQIACSSSEIFLEALQWAVAEDDLDAN